MSNHFWVLRVWDTAETCQPTHSQSSLGCFFTRNQSKKKFWDISEKAFFSSHSSQTDWKLEWIQTCRTIFDIRGSEMLWDMSAQNQTFWKFEKSKAKKFWGLKIRVDHWIETCRKIYDILGGIFCWDTAEIRLRNCWDMSAVQTFSISFRGLSYAGFPIFSKKISHIFESYLLKMHSNIHSHVTFVVFSLYEIGRIKKPIKILNFTGHTIISWEIGYYPISNANNIDNSFKTLVARSRGMTRISESNLLQLCFEELN